MRFANVCQCTISPPPLNHPLRSQHNYVDMHQTFTKSRFLNQISTHHNQRHLESAFLRFGRCKLIPDKRDFVFNLSVLLIQSVHRGSQFWHSGVHLLFYSSYSMVRIIASICCRPYDPNRIDVYQWSRSREGERDDISGWSRWCISPLRRHRDHIDQRAHYYSQCQWLSDDTTTVPPLRTGRSNPNYIPSECVVLRSMYGYHCVAN